jgi:hypothetical protein
MVRPHPKRILLYALGWLSVGHALANEMIDALRIAAATGAIAKASRNHLVVGEAASAASTFTRPP